MVNKRFIALALSISVVTGIAARTVEKPNGVFNSMDLSLTMGSTGVGFDVSSPIGDYVRLRTGFAFMPHFHYKTDFGIEVGDPNDGESAEEKKSKFDKLAGMMEQYTGYKVDDKVFMEGKPTYYNFKLLVDVFPFHDKRWHFTTGFFLGPSKVAEAVNVMEDMPTLMAVTIYNNMYEKAVNGEPIFEYGNVGISLPPELEEKLVSYGRMGLHVGNYKADGKPYMMEPDANNMVSVKVKANSFKPYLGFGYGDAVTSDKKVRVSFDCGVMFWGGSPSVVTHDGTDLVKDVDLVPGKVHDYVKLMKGVTVFPVLNLRISRTLF